MSTFQSSGATVHAVIHITRAATGETETREVLLRPAVEQPPKPEPNEEPKQ